MSKIVERTLDFLEIFATQKRPLSLSEISRLLGIPVSSCHDVLQSLLQRGYIYELTPRGGYYPTLRFYEVGKTVSEQDPVVLRAEILLNTLRDNVNESVLLAKASGLQARYMLVLEPVNILQYRKTVGDNIGSLYATSAGKALLGSLSEIEFSAYLNSASLKSVTPKTITSKAKLRKEIAEGNERGWFMNLEESFIGITTLSARFVWLSTVFIISIAGPTHRVEPKLKKYGKLLVETCRKLENPSGLAS